MYIPEQFKTRILTTYGSVGEKWLANLAQIIKSSEEKWGIFIDKPMPKLSYNYVAIAKMSDGTPIIFKCGIPSHELTCEISALDHFNGEGAVKVIDADSEQGIMLLEFLQPGETLATISNDDDATSNAAHLMKKLWKPISKQHLFPNSEKWLLGLERLQKHFSGSTGPFPSGLVDKAQNLSEQLVKSQGELVLLHGDLHHENILSATREPWLAIDPKGVIGEREYEIGALLRNPFPMITEKPNLERVLTRRVDCISEILSLEKERIIAWAFIQAVLAAWWFYEDKSNDWGKMLICAKVFEDLI